MQITRMELIFLNSITSGTHIWGIPLRFKRTENFAEIYQKTIESLIQKRLLESDKQLSMLGVAAAKLIDEYKQANQYVLINRMHIALLPNLDAAIIVQTQPGTFEILRQNRAAIFMEILKSYQEFCAAGDRLIKSMSFPLENFLEKIRGYPNNMLLGRFDHNKSMEEGILFWDKKKIYYYDVREEKECLMSAPQVRNFLTEILELKGGNR